VLVTATNGTNMASCAFTVSVLGPNDFGLALGATNLAWGSFGNSTWFVENTATHGGAAAAQTGQIFGGQTSTRYTVLQGPGALGFWWSGSAYRPGVFSLQVDYSTVAGLSGIVGWQQKSVDLSPGSHLVEWTYSLDPSFPGYDWGLLDQVSYTGQSGP